MAKLSLAAAFLAVGLNFVVLKLGEMFDSRTPMLLAVGLCLPAAVLGSASWLMQRSFARSWQVVVCVALAWVGLLYAFEIEKNRGIVAASYLALALPIAALIVEHRCWWFCAKVYVLANVAAMLLAMWFEYQTYGSSAAGVLYRFGFLLSSDGSLRLSNPNEVGGQLAFASVLAFLLYLRDGELAKGQPGGGRHATGVGPSRFNLGWTVLLSMGCLLTASRGAFAAWLGGMGLLWFWGTRWQHSQRLRDLVGITGVLLAGTLFVAAVTEFAPWESLQSRFSGGEECLTASGRTIIWRGAFYTWRSNPRYMLIGTGTGVAPEALGRFWRLTDDDGVTPGSVDAHNAFVEWGLSFGLVGMAAGICLMVTMWRTAHRLDRRGRTVGRQAMLLCFCAASMTFVTFYQLLFVAAGALILASLSQPAAATSPRRLGHSTASVSQLRRSRAPQRWPLETSPGLAKT